MKRLLYISHCVPYPPDKGERIRAFHEIRALSREFEITLACLLRSGEEAGRADALRAWCDEIVIGCAAGWRGLPRAALGLLRGKSVTECYFRSRRLERQLHRVFDRKAFDLVVGYSSGVLPYVLAAPAAARVMDLVDIDSLKWLSYSQGASALASWLYRREAGLVAQLERRAVRLCDAVICVSPEEVRAAPLQSEKLHAVPNGVDADYFRPHGSAADAPTSLVFVGTMNYRPNVEAVCWFADKVWPGLKGRVPGLTFSIVGRNPTRRVRGLAALDGVVVTGSVPDVRPYLSSARAAVAPLQTARGVQNKVLEAMAMARPVVASRCAIEGLDVPDGWGVLLADRPAQWLEILSGLLCDGRRCRRLGRLARELVQQRYAWTYCMEKLVSLCRLSGGGEANLKKQTAGAAYGTAMRETCEGGPAAPATIT